MSKRRTFSPEYREQAVKLVLEEGKSQRQVANDLGIASSVVCEWVKQAKADAGQGKAGALTTAERRELETLRQENRTLKMEREILKKAAAFFAREST